jgi:hypothetical protein
MRFKFGTVGKRIRDNFAPRGSTSLSMAAAPDRRQEAMDGRA